MKTKLAFQRFFSEINLVGQCREYRLPLWQCPQFLFLLMGMIICGTALASYFIGTQYIADPTVVALIVLAASGFLFIIAFLIVQSFERMAEANRMKTEFISVVSHQLRSPLSNLGWSMDYLLSKKAGALNKEQEEYFHILKENTDRMKRLVADLLIVSRIENATMPLNKQNFSLTEKTKSIAKEYIPLAKAANVKISLKSSKNDFKVMADPDQIENAIANLLDNAIRYVQEKGRIEIDIYKKGRRVYFSITDSGVGIPEGEQSRIFQKFFRASNVTKRQTEGSGLGLFIAKSAVERSGGKIYFKSRLGKGTTFWFYLPAA